MLLVPQTAGGNQEISQLRTTIPKCRPRYAFFKSKTSLKISSPRLLNLLTCCDCLEGAFVLSASIWLFRFVFSLTLYVQ